MENTASEAKPRVKNAVALMREVLQQQRSASDTSHPQNISYLLDRLEQFSNNQLDYFAKNVPSSSPFYDYPVGVIVRQISYDLEIIERMATQRSSLAASFQNTLALADQLVYKALAPARALLEPGFTVLAYLQKMPDIRVIPYAPVAVIGIPYTTLNADPQTVASRSAQSDSSTALDFLATPHEAGHYVFWHGYISDDKEQAYAARKPLMLALVESLRDKPFKNNPDVRHWIEEIFADVYGSLIAGPVMAVDFQDLALNRSLAEFTTDDGEHPIPMLRPEVYRIALEQIGAMEELPLQKYIEGINARWQKRLSNRPYFPRSVNGDTLQRVNQDAVLADIEIMVREILRVLLEPGRMNLRDASSGNRVWWLNDAPLPALRNGDVGTPLYQNFLERVANLGAAEELAEIPAVQTDQEWISQFIRDAASARAAGMEFQPLLSGLTPDQTAVLWAGGWATEGPMTYWP